MSSRQSKASPTGLRYFQSHRRPPKPENELSDPKGSSSNKAALVESRSGARIPKTNHSPSTSRQRQGQRPGNVAVPIDMGIACEPLAFGGSSLPLATDLASVVRLALRRPVAAYPSTWPYDDRVLVWLEPKFEAAVRAFHDAGGPALVNLLGGEQLARLDETLVRRLARRVGEDVVGRCFVDQLLANRPPG